MDAPRRDPHKYSNRRAGIRARGNRGSHLGACRERTGRASNYTTDIHRHVTEHSTGEDTGLHDNPFSAGIAYSNCARHTRAGADFNAYADTAATGLRFACRRNTTGSGVH